MYTPKAREANGGQHHDKNGGRKTPGSGSGSEISVDSQDEATGDGSQDVSDGETDAVGKRSLELDLRSRTLMTVEDVEKEKWRDCLQHFLTLPKKVRRALSSHSLQDCQADQPSAPHTCFFAYVCRSCQR
jgi:hypothetical protein